METMNAAMAKLNELIELERSHKHAEAAAAAEIQAKRDRLRKQEASIDRLEKKLADQRAERRKRSIRQADVWIQPIAEALLQRFPGCEWKALGPFGLGCTYSLEIREAGTEGEEGLKLYLQLRHDPVSNEVVRVDFTQNTGQYPERSLGAFNGLNYATVPITAETQLNELVAAGQLS